MPAWVDQGFQEYVERMPRQCGLQIKAFPVEKRSKSAVLRNLLEREGERLLAAIPGNAIAVVLDVDGQLWDTQRLAANLGQWLQSGRDAAFLIGGPDGLAPACYGRADYRWSLSPLTLPHGLVRVVVAEQLFRAWSILRNHPYHRG